MTSMDVAAILSGIRSIYLHLTLSDAHRMGLVSDEDFKNYLKTIMTESVKQYGEIQNGKTK